MKIGLASIVAKNQEISESEIKLETIPSESSTCLPYFIECMAKKHKLLREMQMHIQNSIFTFKEFLKCCESSKPKNQLTKLCAEIVGK